MRKIYIWIASAIIAMSAGASCGSDETQKSGNPVSDIPNPQESDTAPKTQEGNSSAGQFAYGADPGWIMEMESKGMKFASNDGKQGDVLEILKGVGFNAARLRAWVNPKGGQGQEFCDTESLIAKAKRCKALGYRIMINLHYSDSWCDPSQQRKPAAWDNIATIDELAQAAASYTFDVLSSLKDNGIDVEWLQIGNETATGMMTTQSSGIADNTKPSCALGANGGKNYAAVHNLCREKALEVYPKCKIITHFQSGERWDKLSWGLEKLKSGGTEYDMLGVSFYPEISKDGWYETYVDALIENIKKVKQQYGKDVMVCEIGSDMIASCEAKRAIWNTVIRCKSETECCKGVFYWEPECYASFNGYAKGGFLSSGKPSEALEVFSGKFSDLLAPCEPSTGNSDDDAIYIASPSGEALGTLARQPGGSYSGEIEFCTSWENFTATHSSGTKYGPKTSWDNQLEISEAHGELNHFWIYLNNGKAGKYIITFSPESGIWSQQDIK